MSKDRSKISVEVSKTGEVRLRGMAYGFVCLLTAIGILIIINQIFYLKAFGFQPIGTAFYYLVLACFLSISFLIYPASKRSLSKIQWYDWGLVALSVIVNIYLALQAFNILTKGWEYSAPLLPTLAGAILWILALEGVRRAGGTALFVVCAFFSLYPLYANHMPGLLWGRGFSLYETICYYSMGTEALIGIPTRIVANLLSGFMIFGVALTVMGGADWFMRLAMSLMGTARGGPAKVSVISSAFMASLSGSVISNIVTTGSVTIPTMKRVGYPPEYAAAVEACASTGGSIMPPVMGAAGFLIASFLDVPYAEVMIAAFFPATLYYLALILQVDCFAGRKNLQGMSPEEIPALIPTLKQGWFFLFAIFALVALLLYWQVEAKAPFYIMALFAVYSIFRKNDRLSWNLIKIFLAESGKLLGQLAAILAGIGLILGSLSGTGVANAMSMELVHLAGKNVYILLAVGAVTSFILGVGMTATACYLFLAITLVPALVESGLHPMSCHLFVMYWGMISYITPPVALGSITAAAIAGANSMKTAFLSLRIGIASYVIPFFFVISPALILHGSVSVVLFSVVTSMFACVILACSLEGYLYFFKRKVIGIFARIYLFIVAIGLLYPGQNSDVIALSMLALFILWRVFSDKITPSDNVNEKRLK